MRPGRRLARIALAGALLLAAAPALAQRLGQGTGTEVPIWRVLGALFLCLALAVAAAFLLRRRLAGGARPLAFGGPRRLQLVESLRLSHQVDLCVVSCDGGEFLIAATPHGATLIDPHLPRPAPAKDLA
ncbi:MAG TPA: flagellar biosynthetic protein FliO [Allosphingosinicella sp.]|nr:flagellar biosynthetic protein FliO [Allosphingosinicella sp.]